MKIAIHQPQYMPWVGYFHKMANADLFVLLDDVQFKKNEWQHRNRIRNREGCQWLSVPNHYRFPQLITEVTVDTTTRWQHKHYQSLVTCYGKSRFAGDYLPRFEQFFTEQHSTMASLNIASVRFLAGLLGITTPTEISSHHDFPGTSTARLVTICQHFGAAWYLAGAGGHDYMELEQFETAGIQVEFQEFPMPVYPQHHACDSAPFIPGLSAIDLLFNCGPSSLAILTGKNNG
jgi:hypothetical protein